MSYDRAHRLVSGSHVNRYVSQTQAYTYDNAGQITSQVRTGGGAGTETFGYDTGGNRNNASGTPYTNTTNNRISSDGIYNYYYDDEGNMIRRIALVNGQPTGWTRDFQWDQRNRLTAVIDRYGGPNAPINFTYTFRYDAFDRRVFESHDLNGANKYFFYDGEDVAMSIPGNGGWGSASRYLHGPAVDEVLAREEIGTALPIEWVYTDHLGSVRDVVANNYVTYHMDFTAFGQLQAGSNAWYYGFTGREYDHNTGLNYHRSRWLDARIGRWLSEDPIGFPAGDANLNRYVGNQVTTFVDADGLQRRPSLRSRLYSEVDDWGYGTSTEWTIIDAPTAFLGSVAGNVVAKPLVWLWTHWRDDTQCDREEAILQRQRVVNNSRPMSAWGAGVNLYAGATTDRIAYGLVGYDPIAERSLTPSQRIENVAGGTGAYAGTWVPIARVVSPRAQASFVSQMTAAEAARYEAYWRSTVGSPSRYRLQAAPGVRCISDIKLSSRTGETYLRQTIFDEFGRLRGANHFTTHGQPWLHTNPHYHWFTPQTGFGQAIPGTLPLLVQPSW